MDDGRHGTRRLMTASIEELSGAIGVTIKTRAFHYLLVLQSKER
jgi:hypothetical protein